MEFVTRRLTVSDWAPELAGARRAALIADLTEILTPPVLAPLPPAVQSLEHGVAGWIDRQAGLAQVLTVRLRDTEALIGLAMVMRAEPDSAHLGYVLAQAHWGRGYGTELVAGLVAGLTARGAVTLRAGVARDNPASARVLAKAGFLPEVDAPNDAPDDATVHFVRHP